MPETEPQPVSASSAPPREPSAHLAPFKTFGRRLIATSSKQYERLIIGLAPAAAVSVFVIQPVMRFTRPMGLLVAGEVLVFALTAGAFLSVYSRSRRSAFLQIIMILMAGAFIFFGAVLAAGRSDWNDRRCHKIQTAMLRPVSGGRTDLPELFQALGCQPTDGEPRDPSYHPSKADPPSWAEERAHEAFLERKLDEQLSLVSPVEAKAR
ncbi:hypothetical protein SAMN05428984_2623 [Sphingomonas sp. OK281]|nr:hypothetical protein SAMN05428984_2623 [Sphingomonas sp. OK281]